MIRSMNSTIAERFSEIGRSHRIGWRFLVDSPKIVLSFLSAFTNRVKVKGEIRWALPLTRDSKKDIRWKKNQQLKMGHKKAWIT